MGSTSTTDLRAALRQIAAEDLPAVVDAAREAARREAAETLRAALVEELLGQAAGSREGDAWWVYGVVAATDAGAFSELTGIAGAPVETVTDGALTALTSRVRLAEYGDEALREHLEDIAWVERTARAHEAVLEEAMGRSTVVPLRLCTIFTQPEHIAAFLADDRAALAGALERLDGRAEWGLKVFAGRIAAPPAGPGTHDDAHAWLDHKRRSRAAREETERLAAECARACHEALGALADDARLNPVQRCETHGRDAEMVLNGAYLAADGVALADTLAELRERYRPLGLELELTGPWPPFNFVNGP